MEDKKKILKKKALRRKYLREQEKLLGSEEFRRQLIQSIGVYVKERDEKEKENEIKRKLGL